MPLSLFLMYTMTISSMLSKYHFTSVCGSVNICLIIIDNIGLLVFQKLSSLFLKQFTESAETTKLDKQFHTLTTLLVK